MNWRVIDYSTYSGKYNMEYDLNLVRDYSENSPVLRFYGWNPYCISLGANQSFSEINSSKAENENIEIVKRPTGGRAILHAEELTYSVVISSKELSGKLIYEKISKAIVIGLKKTHFLLNDVQLENVNPNFPELLNSPSGSVCFASTAKSEIKYKGKKLVGSAQRKLGTRILQHGSILIGPEHKNLVNYLNMEDDEKEIILKEMEEKTIDLREITSLDFDIHSLQNNIIDGFEKVFQADFIRDTVESC